MDDSKRDVNKQKKKTDPIYQAVGSYLQKKNYPNVVPGEISLEELQLEMEVDSETSRSSSIAYSAVNSDPHVIDTNFTKFSNWIKEVRKRQPEVTDLDVIVAPYFAHLYLEILQRDHTDKASAFFKAHYPQIDKTKCCSIVRGLLQAIANETYELNALKKQFRANKYVLKLSANSVYSLKKFLQDNCHVVMFQVLVTYFKIIEIQDKQEEEFDTDDETPIENGSRSKLNGHAENKNADPLKQALMEAINALRQEMPSTYIASVGNVKDDVTSGLISRQRGIIVYSYNSGIHIRSLITLKQLDGMDDTTNEIILREHSGKIYDFSMMTKENLLVSASHDNTLKLFDLSNYSVKQTYNGHTYPVFCVSSSLDGCYIASGSYDLSAILWATDRNTMLRLCAGHTQEITSIDFHPNSMYFCTGSADKAIRMWSINEGTTVRLLLGSTGVVYSVAYSPCGKFLASASEDKRVRVWDLTTGKQFVEIKTNIEPTIKLQWSKDSRILGAGTIDGMIKYWDFDAINSNPYDNSVHVPIQTLSLGAKLLDMEYCFDTFACLTAQSTKARVYQPEEEAQESPNYYYKS